MKIQESSIQMSSFSRSTKLEQLKTMRDDGAGSRYFSALKKPSVEKSAFDDCSMSADDEQELHLKILEHMIKILMLLRSVRGSSTRRVGSGTMVWNRLSSGPMSEAFSHESQETAFSSSGLVRTADGREISFKMGFSMSRSLTTVIKPARTVSQILADPLVINLSSNVTRVSSQKFRFDLDCDGEEDLISAPSSGSGFLALDKNGDGRINDGSELFGTESGDGFSDLAGYDDDGNGWIDENDAVFNDLKVWIKDGNGRDRLLSLKEADVGAIFLGSVSTDFDYKNLSGKTDGALRSSGIYLRESTGAAMTISHVDLSMGKE